MMTGRLGLCTSRAHTRPTIPSSSSQSLPSQSQKVWVLLQAATLRCTTAVYPTVSTSTCCARVCVHTQRCKACAWGLQACTQPMISDEATHSRPILLKTLDHATRPMARGCDAGSRAPHLHRIPGELVHAGTVQPSDSATTFEGLGLAQSLADHLEGKQAPGIRHSAYLWAAACKFMAEEGQLH